MKIKILTCHDVYNFGASLQAFALQSFLADKGNDVRIVDYKPPYLAFPYKISLFVNPNSSVKKYTDRIFIIRLLYAIKRFLWFLPYWGRKIAFDKFTKAHLRLTRRYRSFNELQQCLPEADTYIVGSDQVWNSVTMLNGLDPVFYLQFAPKEKRKISYAASFGATSISEERCSDIERWLRSFDSISVRESSGVEILNHFDIRGVHVCDPVFLLSEIEWRTKLNTIEANERYVLIYNLTSINEHLINDAKRAAEILGAKLYSVSPMKIVEADRNYINVGPDEFLSFIFNARYVFTNSFHATALSIISQRQFCTYNYHSESNSSRMYSILAEFKLLERLNIIDIDETLRSPIDYGVREQIINDSINSSKCWLLNNI